ncbi:MAG: Gfo/Idh/MocA family oxidoreductase, partial [Bacteroidales bacterium]
GNDPVKFVLQATNEIGADGVIITASNKENEIIHQAAEMSRQRGRIILVGVIGLNILRDDFYKKELTFQVSCSYGPGRYDENYEQKGQDYPIGYVRWTEKRNLETVLNAISSGKLDVNPLITERVSLDKYDEIYGDMRKKGSIASILVYPTYSKRTNTVSLNNQNYEGKKGVFGIIGAGNFTSSTIIPEMKSANANIKYIASAGGLTAKIMAKKGNISKATSDYKEILKDKDVDTVMITTRHNLHAKMVLESLQADKNVFVEKPLCLNEEELQKIINSKLATHNSQLIVGFNRRFAPLAQKMKQLLGEGPKNIIATMNAGFIPANVWIHDLEIGGGRIIGEACHYIDLCTFLAGSKVKAVCMNSMGTNPQENTDNASILLKYENGTNAVINYFSNGSKAYSKERIEAFNQEKTLIIDNWRVLTGYGTKGFSKMKTKLDKGHKEQFRLLIESIKSGKPIIPFDEIVNTTKASFACITSLKENRWIEI